MRKILAMLLALALLLPAGAALAETYPLVEEPITVTGVVIHAEGAGEPRLTWTALEEVTGIHVDWTAVESDAFAVYLAAGEWPDFFHNTMEAVHINDYGVLGEMFVDYTQYLDIMPNLSKTFEEYPDARKVVTETNGAIYQLPYIEESATTTTARVYYREDVLDKFGLAVPTTTEEFYDVLVALKENNGGAAPLITNVYSGSYFEPFMYASFGPSRDPDFEDDGSGAVVFNRTSDQYKHFLEYMNRLYAEGLLHQEFLTLDGTTSLSLAQEGLGVFMDGIAHSLTEADFESGVCEIGVLAPLTSEYDDERVVIGCAKCQTGGLVINAASEYVEELCKMFDILYATEEVVEGTGLYGQAGCYGPEGGMWAFSNEDHTQYEFILPEGYEGTTTDYQYDHVIYTNCGRATALAHAVTSTPGNAQARQIGFVNNLIPYQEESVFPASYLKFTDEEQAEIDAHYLEIKTYVESMRSQFITGVADIAADWDAYVQTIEDMGIADVLEVYQASYDRWNGKTAE